MNTDVSASKPSVMAMVRGHFLRHFLQPAREIIPIPRLGQAELAPIVDLILRSGQDERTSMCIDEPFGNGRLAVGCPLAFRALLRLSMRRRFF